MTLAEHARSSLSSPGTLSLDSDLLASVPDRTEFDTYLESVAPIRVSVVIPTLNEAQNLPLVLDRLPEVDELVIVDGHSVDGTPELARLLRPDAVVITQDGRGKGNALACGFRQATGDIIVMIDADGSTDPAEIPSFVETLKSGADFAKGSRFLDGGGSSDITWMRRAGNRVLSSIVNRLWRVSYTDLCYGYNAFWRQCLETVQPDCAGFEVETLMNIRAASAGLKIVEVPSFEHDRVFGTSNLRPVRDGWRVLKTIVREWRSAEKVKAGPVVDLTEIAVMAGID